MYPAIKQKISLFSNVKPINVISILERIKSDDEVCSRLKTAAESELKAILRE